MRRSSFALVLAAAVTLLVASASVPPPASAASGMVNVAIVTSLGTIDVALDPVHAPVTTKNFLKLVDRKFYNGATFFRAIPDFVIQGGNKAREAPGDTQIPLETPLKTGILNTDGAISMARTSDPNSATSEFFLCDGAQSRLDGSMTVPGYAAFGHVTKNMELVRRIARLPVQGDQLVDPVKIIRISRLP
jgi:peptidyl-prolyl cis-trans isomerase A (cyclophilin A)